MTYEARQRLLLAWTEGRIHEMPLVDYWDANWACAKRQATFLGACRIADPGIVVWPEFQRSLRTLRLKSWYEKGTISLEVAGLLIATGNRSVGSWLLRGRRLERQGKDPLKRRRYVRAMHQLYEAIAEARKLIEHRHFEQIAIRAMNGTTES